MDRLFRESRPFIFGGMLLMASCMGSVRTPVNNPTPVAAPQQTISESLRMGMTQEEVQKAMQERGLVSGAMNDNYGTTSTVYSSKNPKLPAIHVVFGRKDSDGVRHVTAWNVVD